VFERYDAGSAAVDPVAAAHDAFSNGARRSGLAELERLWRDGARGVTIARALSSALVALGRFDEAVDVTVEGIALAPKELDVKVNISWPALFCHPKPGYAVGRVHGHRQVRRRLGDREIEGLRVITAPVVSERTVDFWWRVVGNSYGSAVTGSLWAAASLAAFRADDAGRAVAAERHAAFADPAAPLLVLARAELGMPAPAADPCFERPYADVKSEADAAYGEPLTEDVVAGVLSRHPTNAILTLVMLAWRWQNSAADRAAIVAKARDVMTEPDHGMPVRIYLLNHLAWFLAMDAILGARSPHPDAMVCADLIVPKVITAETAWAYRDTAALVRAAAGDLEAALRLVDGDISAEHPVARAEVQITRAYLSYRRGDLATSRQQFDAVGDAVVPAGSLANWLATRLGAGDGAGI
jgi:hypothetical protein